jgi:zinc/manganese transport system permease protein
MLEAFSQMLWPLLACFVLVGIHAYLGIHVLMRKVIFVDLALAQIAALGAVYAIALGLSFDTDAFLIKVIAIGFTLMGALLCTLTKAFDKKVPHEALIGIIYAASLSMIFLLTSHLPHGSEEVEILLTGNILWVTPKEVLYTTGLYAVVGVVHFIFRRQFFSQVSAFWDFWFYAIFGVVVTSSVGMGGVLLVFSYLVIPSVIGVLLASTAKNRLFVGWAAGVLMSILGILISYHLDLPSGPTIVVMLAGLLALVLLIITFKNQRKLGILATLLTLLFLSVIFCLPHLIYTNHEEHDNKTLVQLLASDQETEIDQALSQIKEQQSAKLPKEALKLLQSSNDNVRAKMVEFIKEQGYLEMDALKQAINTETDDFLKIDMADALLSLGDKTGLLVLTDLANKNTSAKEDAILKLKEWFVRDLENEKYLQFINQNYGKVIFDNESKKYFLP